MLRARAIVGMLPLLGCIVMLGTRTSAQVPNAEQPKWSRAASVLDTSCTPAAAKLLSPDRRFTVDVQCDVHNATDSPYLLRLRAGKKQIAELVIPESAHEIVWSPDSHAFFLDGGESADFGFFVRVYTIDDQAGVREHDVTSSARRDMVDAFPPCKAANHAEDCKRIESNPEYNMSGLGWTADSEAIFILSAVPCTGSYGGIMCQVRGYEINVADGQIVQRLSAQQVKQHWQAMAAWNISVPDPPEFGTTSSKLQ